MTLWDDLSHVSFPSCDNLLVTLHKKAMHKHISGWFFSAARVAWLSYCDLAPPIPVCAGVSTSPFSETSWLSYQLNSVSETVSDPTSFVHFLKYLLIYFEGLCWVFAAGHRLSPAAESGGRSWLWPTGFSLWGLPL